MRFCHSIAFVLLLPVAFLSAQERVPLKLEAPDGWRGETLKLPPTFAPDMKLNGWEHIRFAPGMMKADSDTFFCYAFVFELEKHADLSEQVVNDEFLKYYRQF